MEIICILLYILERERLIELLLLISVVIILVFIRVDNRSNSVCIMSILPIEQVLLTLTILAIFIAILSCLDLFLVDHSVDSLNWFSLIQILLFLLRLLLLLVVDVDLQL